MSYQYLIVDPTKKVCEEGAIIGSSDKRYEICATLSRLKDKVNLSKMKVIRARQYNFKVDDCGPADKYYEEYKGK